MIKTGRGKEYFCWKCGEEITYSRVMYRASLCVECYEEMEIKLKEKNIPGKRLVTNVKKKGGLNIVNGKRGIKNEMFFLY